MTRRRSTGRKKIVIRENTWTCTSCPTINSGPNNRCKSCGNPRSENDGEKFNFDPSTSPVVSAPAEVARALAGPDRTCSSCGTDNPADARQCVSCGNPIEADDTERGRKLEQEPILPPKTREQPQVIPIIGALCFIVIFSYLAWFLLLETKSVKAIVVNHEWKMGYEIEEERTITSEAWEDNVPFNARVIRRTNKQRDTEPVVVGTEWVKSEEENLENGYTKETMEEVEIIEDKPIYDTWCTYQYEDWVYDDTKEKEGVGKSPSFPILQLQSTQRIAGEIEEYWIVFEDENLIERKKLFPAMEWERIEKGERFILHINRIGSILFADKIEEDR